jgi:hypothetical protein
MQTAQMVGLEAVNRQRRLVLRLLLTSAKFRCSPVVPHLYGLAVLAGILSDRFITRNILSPHPDCASTVAALIHGALPWVRAARLMLYPTYLMFLPLIRR